MRFLRLGCPTGFPTPHDLAVPGEAHRARRSRAVRPVRRGAARGRLRRMGEQIIDASLIAAPKQRNISRAEEGDQGRTHQRGLEGEARQAPAQGPRRALDGQVQQGKARPDGTVPPFDIAIQPFGYENHVSMTRTWAHPRWDATDAAATRARGCVRVCSTRPTPRAPSGPTRPTAPRSTRTSSKGTASSAASTARSLIGRPMPEMTRRANALKSKSAPACVCLRVQKDKMDLFVRTIGIAAPG